MNTTFIGKLLVTRYHNIYDIKEAVLDALIQTGLANNNDTWTIQSNIDILCTDQINVALGQRNTRPTFFLEFYSKVPLRYDGPTIDYLQSAISALNM